MMLQQKLSFLLIYLLGFGQHSSARKYRFELQDEDIFSECKNQPNDVLNIEGLFDFSELTRHMSTDTVAVSGNLTTIWDIQPTDRIQCRVETYHWNRGNWEAMVFNLNMADFCRCMYDERQYWYMYWSKFIINKEDVRSNCLNVLGTKLIMEPYDLDMIFDLGGLPMDGRYKLFITFKAFDNKNVMRKDSICFEIIGEYVRL